ncbi:MAG: hypothetical protein ACYC4M_05655 [Thermoleophilia bacterium]
MSTVDDSSYKYYLYDLGYDIKLRALEAKHERDDAPDESDTKSYHAGRIMAFNEIISMMQQQAEGFGIPFSDLRLDDIDPDKDLL